MQKIVADEFIKRVEPYETDLGPDGDTRLVRAVVEGKESVLDHLENSFLIGMIEEIHRDLEPRSVAQHAFREWMVRSGAVRAQLGEDRGALSFHHYGLRCDSAW